MTTTNVDSPPSRKKRRNLMEYYGVETEKPQLQESSLSDRRPDPLDLDHPAFNSTLYLNKYLYEVSLPDLIQRDNDLVTEIKELDGDMKTLVYENYSKFISATDTIKQMRLKVDSMEGQVNRLAGIVDAIDVKSCGINESLGGVRERIQQLSGVHNLLKKLNFVFELPDKLSACYKRKEYDQAVRYYSKTYNLLSHYGHLTMFKKIADESAAIMRDVSKKVREKLVDNSSNLSDIGSCIGMLCGLATQTPNELAKLYISTVEPKFRKIIDTTLSEVSKAPLKSPSTSQPEDPITLRLIKLNIILTTLASFTTSFNALFSNCILIESLDNPTTPLSSSSEGVSLGSQSSFQPKMTIEERDAALNELKIFAKSVVQVYFDSLQKSVEISMNGELPLTPSSYNTLFSTVRSHFSMESMRSIMEITSLSLESRVDFFVDDSISGIVNGVFKRSLDNFCASVKNIGRDRVEELGKVVAGVEGGFVKGLGGCLNVFKEFMGSEEALRCNLLGKVRSGLERYWGDLFVKMEVMAKCGDFLVEPYVGILILARLAMVFGSKSVEGVYKAFGESLYGMEIESPVYRKGAVKKVEHEIMVRARGVNGDCRTVCQRLLKLFVVRVCNDFAGVLRESYRDIVDGSSGTEPSAVWVEFFGMLGRVDKSVVQLFPDDGTLSGKRAVVGRKAAGGGQFDALRSGIDKLFAARVEIFGSVEATRGGILTGVLKGVAKCFIEEVRMVCLNGVAQIGADVEYWRRESFGVCVDDECIGGLLDEVLNSAQGRSL